VAANPFPNRPPKYVRALLYEYRFADPGTYVQTGQWWGRRLEGLYFPRVSLADFSRGVPPETAPLLGIRGIRREAAKTGFGEQPPPFFASAQGV